MCEKLLFTFFLLFICLGVLLMSHDQCTRCCFKKKKKKKKKMQMLSAKRGSKSNLNGSVWIELIVVETKTESTVAK